MDSYMARCPTCSGTRMVCTAEPSHAEAVAECIAAGYTVDRVTLEYVRTGDYRWGCTCEAAATAEPVQLELGEA